MEFEFKMCRFTVVERHECRNSWCGLAYKIDLLPCLTNEGYLLFEMHLGPWSCSVCSIVYGCHCDCSPGGWRTNELSIKQIGTIIHCFHLLLDNPILGFISAYPQKDNLIQKTP